MSAYVVVDVDVTDPAGFEQYRQQVRESIARYGGRYIVRGGKTETLEALCSSKPFVILEFPDRSTPKAWWSSQEYADAKALRQRCARTELIVVDGV